MNDGHARLALVLEHQDPYLLDGLSLPQRLAVEADLNAQAEAEVPSLVRDRWASGDPLILVLPDGTTLELVPRGLSWTQANLRAYLEQEVVHVGSGSTLGPTLSALCRICPPPFDHEDRTASPIHRNRAPWTVSVTVGPTTFVARVWLEILVVFPDGG